MKDNNSSPYGPRPTYPTPRLNCLVKRPQATPINCVKCGTSLGGKLLQTTQFTCDHCGKKFNMCHKQIFSPLWTVLSIAELSLFAVFTIVIILGLIPISVLLYSMVIYTILSVLILSNKIKKVSKFTT